MPIADPNWFQSFCFYYREKTDDIYYLLKENFQGIRDVAALLKLAPYDNLAKQLHFLLVIDKMDFQDDQHVQAIFARIAASLKELTAHSEQPLVL